MPGKYVHLKRHLREHLLVAAEIIIGPDQGLTTDPLTFIVDTASAKTLIVPECRRHIEARCPVSFGFGPGKRVSAQSMLGPIEYEAHSGFCLVFECIDGSPMIVEPDGGELCFAAEESLLKAPLHHDATQAFGAEVPFNVLGRDVLNQATLICPPHAEEALLIFDWDITPKLRQVSQLKRFLYGEGRPVIRTSISPLTDEQAFLYESAPTRREERAKDSDEDGTDSDGPHAT